MQKTNYLTEGSIAKALLTLALPIIAANILHSCYQMTDAFWVGRLGSSAIASISISFPVLFLCSAIGGGFAVAGTILVSQYMGKADKKAIDYISAQTLLMGFFVSVVIASIGYFFTPLFITFLRAEQDVFAGAVSYLKISFAGMVFVFTFMVFQSLMRGVGDVKTPMFIVLGTVILNFILDPLFIFGYKSFPPMGVSGAALATIITQAIAAILGIALLLKGRNWIHLKWRNMKPDFSLIGKMFNLGLPASMEQSTVAIGMTALIFLVTSFGTIVLAAYGIVSRLNGFVIVPTIGLSMATSTLVGQNIGAGKMARAVKTIKLASIISFVALTLIGVIMFVYAYQLSAIFAPGQTETIEVAVKFIKIASLFFGFMGVYHILNGAFIGSGNTMVTMILSIISLWFLRFPIAFVLSKYTPFLENGIWISFPATNVISAFITFLWFSRGTWKQKRITEEISLSFETRTEEKIVAKFASVIEFANKKSEEAKP
ncbi:MATE family efflux transporter [bacterium]|nr:MATE family efflux transporter [bacterium]